MIKSKNDNSNNALISIIVPIYGIERFLGTCIESIIKQTYKNIEIILVDDGSLDRCYDICELYKLKDKRIKVIHKENGGLVSARKAGLEIATGEYVGFVDGDDWIEPTFYELLYAAISESDSDIAIAGQSKDLFETRSKIESFIPSGHYVGSSLMKLQRNMLSYGDFFRIGITTYVWNKLFRRSMLEKHQYAVPNEITVGEDAAVVYPYLMECKSVKIINDCGYHYQQRENSMLKSNDTYQKEAIGLRKLYYHLCSFAEKYPDEYRLKEQVVDFMLGICIMRSGGILHNLQDDYCPYDKEFYGKDIVIWSAGTFGQQLMYRINEYNYCNVVGWIDTDFWEYRRCCLNVDSIDEIDNMEYDYILLATVNSVTANSIKSKFVWRGIDESKILTVAFPKGNKELLIERYLGI